MPACSWRPCTHTNGGVQSLSTMHLSEGLTLDPSTGSALEYDVARKDPTITHVSTLDMLIVPMYQD